MSFCVLHTLDTSANEKALEDCLRVVNKGDALVLLGDGVYAAARTSAILDKLTALNIPLYALQRDCEARGVLASDSISLIDVTQLVVLTEDYPRQLAWY